MMPGIEEVIFQKIEIKDTDDNILTGMYTENRVKTKEVPNGFYKYEIRYSDNEYDVLSTIEKSVYVNFGGTLITNEKIEYNKKNYTDIQLYKVSAPFGHGFTDMRKKLYN